jgi:hypothetical protein
MPGCSHNARFGREPANAKDLHRKLTVTDDLDEILAWREERTVTQNLTLHDDRMMLILEPTPLARGLVRKKVEVVNYPDGRFAVQCNGTSLAFRVFDKIRTGLANRAWCIRATGIDPPLHALIEQTGVDRVDDFLGQGSFRQALLVAALTPVVLDIPVIAPILGIFPKAISVENFDNIRLGFGAQQLVAQPTGVNRCHCSWAALTV